MGSTKDCRRSPPPQPAPAREEGAQQRKRRGLAAHETYGSTEIGEKSMNQLFGWITPFTFGLMARGPTS